MYSVRLLQTAITTIGILLCTVLFCYTWSRREARTLVVVTDTASILRKHKWAVIQAENNTNYIWAGTNNAFSLYRKVTQ